MSASKSHRHDGNDFVNRWDFRCRRNECVLMYRVSHGTAPSYLCELCKPCTDSRLRSKSRGDFSTPRTRLRFTDNSFAVSAPYLPGTHCQLTFVIVVARQHSRNVSRLSSFMQLLICINILLFYFYYTISVVCVYYIRCVCVLYCT